MTYKVFLSHSSTDKAWIEWIAANTRAIGVDVYLYEHDPQPGTYIASKIQQAIQGSDALLVLLTQNSQFSPYVQQEIGFAQASKKLIIPLVQSGIQPQSLAMLQGREYIPFDPYNNPQETVSKLLTYLDGLHSAKKKSNDQAILILGLLLLILFGGKK